MPPRFISRQLSRPSGPLARLMGWLMNRHNARMNAFAVAQIDLETCRPGFSVGDLDAFHAKMMEHNVVCIEAPRPLHGIRLAQYADPDGLVVSIGEARTPR